MSIQAAQINLNGGEISPMLHYRADLDKHASGLAQCKNFIPLPFGGVRKRPGTKYCTQFSIDSSNTTSRMFPFRASDGTDIVIIFTFEDIYFYRVSDGATSDIPFAWTGTTPQLADLRICALNDYIFITSPYHHPLKLTYTSFTDWKLEKITFTETAKLDENLLENTKISVLSNPVASAWSNGANYVVGNNRLNTEGTCEYTCTQNHTANASRKPGTGATWREFWKVTTYAEGAAITLKTHIGIANWSVSAVSYARLQYVDYNGTPYRCLIAHTSGVSTTPGAETVIGTYWEKCTDVFNSLHVAVDSTYKPAANFTASIRRDDQSNQSSLPALTGSDGTTSTAILIRGAWTFTTYGTWSGTFTIQRSRDGGTNYETVGTYQSSKDRNVSIPGEETEAVWMRLLFTKDGSTPGSGDHRGVLEPALPYVAARFDIVSYSSARSVTATARGISFSGTTDKWQENAFNRLQGYPRAIAFHERRLYFAGTIKQPLGIWASVIEDFLNFTTGSKDDDSFFIVLAANTQNHIKWLASQRRLFIGTEYSEWVIGSELNDNTITPTNFLAREYTTYGSANMEPINIGDAVVFAQRNGKRVREMAYQSDRETYDSADLTRLAEHVFQEGGAPTILQMAWQQNKEPILWCVLDNGKLATFSYIRNERINAWAQHETSEGEFKSVCVVKSTTNEDTIFFMTKRKSGSYLEKITPEKNALDSSNDTDSVVFDFQQTAAKTAGNALPSAAEISFDVHYSIPIGYLDTTSGKSPAPILYTAGGTCPVTATYKYGLLVTASLKTLPIDIPTQIGSSIGRKKRIHKVRVHVRPSYGLQVDLLNNATDTNPPALAVSYDTFLKNVTDDTTGRLLYSGWIEQNVTLSGPNVWIHLFHNHPSPCTITALVAEMEVYQQ